MNVRAAPPWARTGAGLETGDHAGRGTPLRRLPTAAAPRPRLARS